jgi:type II secretory pathway pseudopilin PulG
MPTGKRASKGYTYLLLLFVLAIGGAGLAALGQRWQTLAQRERETELIWRGLQLRDAIERYVAASPPGAAGLPATLQDLLQDRRQSTPRHWLRQLYADPFTGAADWVLLRHPEGGIQGVASRSTRPALRRHGLPAGVTVVDSALPRVADWQFKTRYEPPPKPRATTIPRSTR